MKHVYNRSVIKLSLLYGTILALVALFFSVNWYVAATGEIERALDRQTRQLRGRDLVPPGFEDARTEQLEDAKKAITLRLVTANIFVVTVGSLGSYALARRTLRPIKESYDAQERFTSDASHELRTPLTSIISQTEVALRSKKLSQDDAAEVLASNLEDATAMSMMVENLLVLSRQGGLSSSDFRKVAVAEILSRAQKDVRFVAKKHDVQIKTQVSPDLFVVTHPESMVRIVSILLDNAVKFSPKQSKVTLNAKKERSQIVISVSDTGKGMTKSEASHIFERFYQADSSRSHNQGYGLGLPLAQRLAEVCNAKIEVQSQPKKGSTFRVMLPLA